jgi:hypothetical protein
MTLFDLTMALRCRLTFEFVASYFAAVGPSSFAVAVVVVVVSSFVAVVEGSSFAVAAVSAVVVVSFAMS